MSHLEVHRTSAERRSSAPWAESRCDQRQPDGEPCRSHLRADLKRTRSLILPSACVELTDDQIGLQLLSHALDATEVVIQIFDAVDASRLHQRLEFLQCDAKLSAGLFGGDVIRPATASRRLLLLGHSLRRGS